VFLEAVVKRCLRLPIFQPHELINESLYFARQVFVGTVKQPQSAPIFPRPVHVGVFCTAIGCGPFHAEGTLPARIGSALITAGSR
jgi:hypothetical protein